MMVGVSLTSSFPNDPNYPITRNREVESDNHGSTGTHGWQMDLALCLGKGFCPCLALSLFFVQHEFLVQLVQKRFRLRMHGGIEIDGLAAA